MMYAKSLVSIKTLALVVVCVAVCMGPRPSQPNGATVNAQHLSRSGDEELMRQRRTFVSTQKNKGPHPPAPG
jgi:hypothetical protein